MVGLAGRGWMGEREGGWSVPLLQLRATEGNRASPFGIWEDNAVYHDPLAGSVLIYKHMVGLLSVKGVGICHSLAVLLEPLG